MKIDAFITVENAIKSKVIEAAILVAGITFTLFGWSDNNEADFSFEQSIKIENAETQESTSVVRDGTVTFLSNDPTTSEKIERAFDSFASKNNENKKLKCVCDFIQEGIGDIKSKEVAIDACVAEGLLNVSLMLTDGAILSINKRIDSLDSQLVAFNIFKNRKLIVSDIIDINTLSSYIHNVQKRLG